MIFVRFVSRGTHFVLCSFIVAIIGCGSANFSNNHAAGDLSGGDGGRETKTDRLKPHPSSKTLRNDLIRHEFKVGEIQVKCDNGLSVLNLRLGAEVDSAFVLDEVLADAYDEITPLIFMSYVHKDKSIRSEGSACEEQFNRSLIDVFTRRDLYRVVKRTTSRDPDQQRLVKEFTRQFELNGMSLSDADLEKFKILKSQLTNKETLFAKNLGEDNSTVAFSAEELAGTSPDFQARLNRDQAGHFVVSTKSTDFLEVMENATPAQTRRRMLSAYDNRAAIENTKLIEEAIVLRQQIARLLNYKNWADYRIDGRMAGNANNALALIADNKTGLKARLRPRLEQDMRLLLQAKQELENPQATEMFAWDVRYFANQIKKKDFSIDDNVIREYFPKDTVMAGMFAVYSRLLGVHFEEVRDASVWSPEVKLYAVRDSESRAILSYFFTDFVPREGKYGHAAAFPLISGRVMRNEYYSQPVSAIVANFSPPTASKPSLLTHDEVETLFHEFGHIMHQTLTRAPYAYLSGSNTAQDFVEAPSQMLENWVWNAEILKMISGHYRDTQQKLPADLIAKMIAAKDFNQGYHYSRQIMLGLTDLTFHMSQVPVDVTAVFKQIHQDVLGFSPIEDSHFVAGFGHLMGGYDAGYYGYIWSEVFAADMFTAFQAKGLLHESTGARYKHAILEQGSMVEPMSLIKLFLGREPNDQAFLKRLGL